MRTKPYYIFCTCAFAFLFVYLQCWLKTKNVINVNKSKINANKCKINVNKSIK